MTTEDLHTRAQHLTKPEAEKELVRLWELEESLKPKEITEEFPQEESVIVYHPEGGIFESFKSAAGNWWCMDGTNRRMTRMLTAPTHYWNWPKFNLEGDK